MFSKSAHSALLLAVVVLTGCNEPVPESDTMQSCAKLLPKGDLYYLEVRGTIDTGTEPPTLEGAFETFSDDVNSDEMQAFSNCMRKVIQPTPMKGVEVETKASP